MAGHEKQSGVCGHEGEALELWFLRAGGAKTKLVGQRTRRQLRQKITAQSKWGQAVLLICPGETCSARSEKLPDTDQRFANVRDQSCGAKRNDEDNLFKCEDGLAETAPVGQFKPDAQRVRGRG